MAERRPPKSIPTGDVSKLADPWDTLLESDALPPEIRESLRPVVEAHKAQMNLLNLQIRTLNSQVQHLLAQFDWTK